jgi:acyl-coenzyme A thioesterase PaaI-like protein
MASEHHFVGPQQGERPASLAVCIQACALSEAGHLGRSRFFVEVEAGKAVFAGKPGEHAYNPIGAAHGGCAATLLDSNWLR